MIHQGKPECQFQYPYKRDYFLFLSCQPNERALLFLSVQFLRTTQSFIQPPHPKKGYFYLRWESAGAFFCSDEWVILDEDLWDKTRERNPCTNQSILRSNLLLMSTRTSWHNLASWQYSFWHSKRSETINGGFKSEITEAYTFPVKYFILAPKTWVTQTVSISSWARLIHQPVDYCFSIISQMADVCWLHLILWHLTVYGRCTQVTLASFIIYTYIYMISLLP